MSPLIGYLGALAVGMAVMMLVVGRSRRTAGQVALGALAFEGDARLPATYDQREARLREGLLDRVVRPAIAGLASAGRRITPGARGDAIRSRLDNAGSSLTVEIFFAAKMAAVGVGLLLSLLYAVLGGPKPVLVVVLAVALGYALPDLLLHSQGQKRQTEISRTLPEALDLLALTVRAGLGFEQGVEEVTEELNGPLANELDRMLKEQQLGRSRRDALLSLHERNRSEELRPLIAALLQADKLGTPMADTLTVQSREMRRRRRAAARERAGKAPVKLLFPLIFGIFPAMFVIIIGPGVLQIMDNIL